MTNQLRAHLVCHFKLLWNQWKLNILLKYRWSYNLTSDISDLTHLLGIISLVDSSLLCSSWLLLLKLLYVITFLLTKLKETLIISHSTILLMISIFIQSSCESIRLLRCVLFMMLLICFDVYFTQWSSWIMCYWVHLRDVYCFFFIIFKTSVKLEWNQIETMFLFFLRFIQML